ncbi:MAG: RagB/SusD family nutrient uptake outer membrane protein [Flavobacteriaceae bacterium]|nr:RagB/SusD family nutrient uptake outer membrane protein [Flavobacteriaceae bacterium]
MKKYILFLTIVSITLFSCDDKLETFPSSSISADEAFQNEGDFTNALLGVYLNMLSGSYYGGSLQGYDVMSDNLIISTEGRLSQQIRFDWEYTKNAGFRAYMTQTYRVIRNANFIIKNIDVLDAGSFKDNALGEALAIRALTHFDVVRFFGEIPTQSSGANASLGMPYITAPDINELPARITVADFYTNILSDLNTAAGLINSDNGVYRMGRNAVNATLADVHLHMGNWGAAINSANNVSASVATRPNFTGVWNDSNKDGVIFGLRNDDVTSIGLGVPYSQTANGIKSEYVPDFAFYQMYNANDIRLTAYFETSDFGGALYNHVLKWYSSTIATSLGNVDAKIVRAAEVMLIKAEAYSELNQDGSALAALDMVRSQRYSSFVSGGESGQALKDAIALERRLELAFEGTRFTDIKRYGIDVQRSSFGHLFDGTGAPATFQLLPAGDFRFQAPISINELNTNPNMVQNPGYDN